MDHYVTFSEIKEKEWIDDWREVHATR